ncbi:MAG: hypothetical protein M3Y87_02905 [Myxococcota bacterium]|nr:hypothetical protein [Myxococcota bacterium]
MTELELSADFRDLLLELADAEAEFVLIGGWALALHPHVRGTDDLADVEWLETHDSELPEP